jgi:hypothetical protein
MADETVSLRQFAAMQGWNPGHAHRLKMAGRLVMVNEGGRDLVHVARSLERIAESSDPQKGYMSEVNARQRAQHRAGPAPRPSAAPPATPPLPLDGESSGQQSRNATFNQARTAREVYEAKLAQLRYEQEVGKVVNAEQVRAEFGKQVIAVRDLFLRLPERLAPMLVGQSDMTIVKRTLEVEIRAVLSFFKEAA